MSRCVLTELVVLLSGGFANRLLDAADSASSDVSKLVVLDCLRHTRLVHEIFRLLGSLLGTLSSGLLGGLGRLARRLHVRVLEGFGYIAELPLTPRTATSGGVATSRDPQLQCFAAPPDRNDRTVTVRSGGAAKHCMFEIMLSDSHLVPRILRLVRHLARRTPH